MSVHMERGEHGEPITRVRMRVVGLTSDGQENDCTHGSATGIDTTPIGPGKVWRCDHCGLRWTDGTEPVDFARVLADHADCVANDSGSREWVDGSGVTGVDVWSCGIEVPFVDDLDAMQREHLAVAIRDALHHEAAHDGNDERNEA